MQEQSGHWQRRLSRRQALKGAALGGAGLAAAAAISCRKEQKPTTPSGEEMVRRGGTFRYVMAPPGHLDIMQLFVVHVWKLTGVVYNRLAKLTPVEFEPIPDLVQSWEQPDPLTLVFKLTPGVKFHNKPPVNGRALKASDVVFSLDRVRSKEPLFVHNADYRAIDRMETPDDTTIRIRTTSPDASLLSTLASPQSIIIAQEVIDRFGDLKRPEAQVGTGPFILGDFRIDTGGKLSRNPEYFKPGLPYLDGLDLGVMFPPQDWNLFLAGQMDSQGTGIPREEAPGFDAEARGLVSALSSVCGGNSLGMRFNLERKPFDDIRVRRALSLILDRVKALEVAYPGHQAKKWAQPAVALGFEQAKWDLSPEERERLPWGWSQATKQRDIQEGVRMLEAAGFTRANPLRFGVVGDNNPGSAHGPHMGEGMKGYFESVTEGRVRVEPLEYVLATEWRARSARGEYDVDFGLTCVGWDVDHPLSKNHASDGGRNYGRWKDPEMDRLLEKERTIFNVQERKAAVHAAQRYIADQVPLAWIGWGATPTVHRKNVRNHIPGNGWEQLEHTWLAS